MIAAAPFLTFASRMALLSALSIALLLTPFGNRPAHADRKGAAAVAAGVLILGAFACARDPRCGGRAQASPNTSRSTKGGGRVNPGPTDALALSQTQRVQVQQGLARLGFYGGSIDGIIGAGTRGSIRSYQASMGETANGYLTGPQINRLIAASPYYAAMTPGDVRLFEADLARDLDRDGIRRLQTMLNDMGYDAGPVDGAWGKRTRAAVAAYKHDHALPGAPVPSVRLVAYLEGGARPGDAGPAIAVHDGMPGARVVAPGGAAEEAAPAGDQGIAVVDETPVPTEVAPARVLNFELAAMRIGITQEEFVEIATERLGSDAVIDTAGADRFGGDEVLSLAVQATTADWPEIDGDALPEQLVALFDETLPEFGALAIFRTILMPPEVTKEVFDSSIVPGLIESYGIDGKVADRLIWIGDATALAAAETSPAALRSCGALRVAQVSDAVPAAAAVWSEGNGTMMDSASLASATAACGDVLTVEHVDGSMRLGLWNSDFLVERRETAAADGETVAIPKIDF